MDLQSNVLIPDFESLQQSIKKKARQLGFSLVGVTTCEPPAHLDVYQNWIAAGYHGEMGWLATERAIKRRADPHEILKECQSILVLGMLYEQADNFRKRDDHGRIASYAIGKDYHDRIPPLLREIVRYIEEQVGEHVPNRVYTDTGSIMEREIAQRAGLGWIGKNTCLINPKEGSYFFLAEIFLGIALDADEPFLSDQCGSCTRCIEVCPTSCILPNRTIDASRCISYLTIELKSEIPEELRALIGDWVFGCDVCQQVCPWNQPFSTHKKQSIFDDSTSASYPDLDESLSLTTEKFNRLFKGSAVKRTKRRGYLRNIAVAAGNQGSPNLVKSLVNAMQDPESLVRRHVAWALGQIGGDEALDVLRIAAQKETDEQVLDEINNALETCFERS